MQSSAMTGSARPVRWGLAAKLFAILILLGATAVVVTSVMGYVRSRDALEQAIFNQLTAARETKTRQVETYFRTISNELRLLAASKMVVDATRGFRIAVDELDQAGVPAELRDKVGTWYGENFLLELRRVTGTEPILADYLPVRPGSYYLQYHYMVENPHPAGRRRLLDDAGDGSAYSKVHSVYHPLMRAAATTVGFDDFMLADARTGRLVYTVDKDVDFATSFQTGPYRHSNAAIAVARCATAAERSATCLEDFALYAPAIDPNAECPRYWSGTRRGRSLAIPARQARRP
jgi:hypothetical protein